MVTRASQKCFPFSSPNLCSIARTSVSFLDPHPRLCHIIEKRHDFVEAMDNWTKEFFNSQGENAYAAFCVLAAAASRPVAYFTSENRMNSLQEKVGKWSHDFTDSVKKPSFDIDKYLSGDCQGAAKSLREIYAEFKKGTYDNGVSKL